MKSIYLIGVIFVGALHVLSAQAQPSNVPKYYVAAVEQGAGRIDFYNPQNHKRVAGIKLGSLPHEITLSKDKKTAFVTNFGLQDYDETIGTPGNSISVIDLNAYAEKYRLYTGKYLAPHGVKVRPHHPNQLYVNTEFNEQGPDSNVLAFDLDTRKITKSFKVPAHTHNFIFTPDGKSIWLQSGPNGLTKINADNGKEEAKFSLGSSVHGVTYINNDSLLMVSGDSEIAFVDPQSLKVVKRFKHSKMGQLLYSAITPDGGRIIAPSVWYDGVFIVDVKTNKIIKHIPTGIDPVHVAIDKLGQFAYVSGGRSAEILKINLDNYSSEIIKAELGTNGLALIPARKVPHRKVLTVAAALPMTGSDKALGRDKMLGYDYWRNQVNDAGGLLIGGVPHTIQIAYGDTRSNKSKRERVLKKLIKEQGATIVFSSDDQADKKFPSVPLPMLPPAAKTFPGTERPIATFNKNFKDYYNLDPSVLSTRAMAQGIMLKEMLGHNLYLPKGKGPFPGVVLAHGSAGLEQAGRDWAKYLNKHGYAVYLMDAFSAHGYKDRKSIGWDNAVKAELDDAPNSIRILMGASLVDKQRIGLLGFSLGGYTTLREMEHKADNTKSLPIKVAASFYGHCQRFSNPVFRGDIAIFVGDDDDRSPLEACERLTYSAQGKGGAKISLYHYAHAKHGFDNKYFPASKEMISEDGQIYHLGYNKVASKKAHKDLVRYFNKNLNRAN